MSLVPSMGHGTAVSTSVIQGQEWDAECNILPLNMKKGHMLALLVY